MSDQPIALHAKKNPGGRPTERGETKRATINMRTTPSTRAALEAAAAVEGRSLAQEIEQRLERSIAADQVRGGVHNVRLLDAMASEIATVETFTGKHWNEDQVTFQLMLLSVTALLKRHAPMIENGPEVVAAIRRTQVARNKYDAALDLLKAEGEIESIRPTLEGLINAGIRSDNNPENNLESLEWLCENKLEAGTESHIKTKQMIDILRELKDSTERLKEAYSPQRLAAEKAAVMFKDIRDAREMADSLIREA